ncbi:MAG: 50S ribosomal protein L17 [Armatimonadetes bacterium]|nr:50S ribosomal protein L17 [Armatimonadota bacterium]
MRHRVKSRTLGRKSAHRLMMLRNLAISLLRHRRIETTLIRAKEVASFVEDIITSAKKGDLVSKRIVFSQIHDREVSKELFDVIAKNYKGEKTKESGYTRLIKVGNRKGDNAPIVILELV